MSDIVLSVENIWKQYRLGLVDSNSLKDDLARWWASIRGKEDPTLQVGSTNDRENIKGEYVWALQDVNFEVKQGDVLGIIGKNGAGKSTLLKILSKVTSPTKGQIKTKGRIASLLEVGTGFHPELTGRENIFLNGAILGMTKNDIKSKFDEIVGFSGIGKYIDTPVKRYSSGMYVRLAFAVAAHLEPEILIIDEVLAVGDAEFQKKCLGKMKDVSGEGRTVLFVSHNITAVNQLCTSCILLKNGLLSKNGNTEEVLFEYLSVGSKKNSLIFKEKKYKNQFLFLAMFDKEEKERYEFKFDENIIIKLNLKVDSNMKKLELAMRLVDNTNRPIFTIHEPLSKYNHNNNNYMNLEITIPANFITPGTFSWIMCINNPDVELFDLQENILQFSIVDTGSDFHKYKSSDYGCVFSKYIIQKLN